MLHNTLAPVSGFASHILKILVVEDEEPIRIFLTEYFEDCGYLVQEAANVAQAKRLLTAMRVDVVFSDINMPGGETGFVLEKWIRQHYPDTRVLLTSGFPQGTEDTKDLLEPVIPKPYSFATISRRIDDVVTRCRLIQPMTANV